MRQAAQSNKDCTASAVMQGTRVLLTVRRADLHAGGRLSQCVDQKYMKHMYV